MGFLECQLPKVTDLLTNLQRNRCKFSRWSTGACDFFLFRFTDLRSSARCSYNGRIMSYIKKPYTREIVQKAFTLTQTSQTNFSLRSKLSTNIFVGWLKIRFNLTSGPQSTRNLICCSNSRTDFTGSCLNLLNQYSLILNKDRFWLTWWAYDGTLLTDSLFTYTTYQTR